MTNTATPGPLLTGALFLIAGVSIAVPALVVRQAPPAIVTAKRIAKLPRHRQVLPPTVLPAVEPVELVDLSPEEAQAYNADVPFSTAANPAARPFRLRDGPEDLARATDCLAAAVLYEAGNDPDGQKAVAQVVLNRVRHPAFPKTVCGVVFEGQERRTGCQFTFTCDGALTRWSPSAAMWEAARKIAAAALSGAVYRPVGYATHYHTDWVVPYWQSSLDKIAAVHSHLFFRWAGWWGTPPAFNRQVQAVEPVIAGIAAFSDAHRTGGALVEADAALAEAQAVLPPPLPGTPPADTAQPIAGDPTSFLVTLPAGLAPDLYPQLAARACGERSVCKFLAWTDKAQTPAQMPPRPEQIEAMTFRYLRDRSVKFERTSWNCQQTPRSDPRQCMRGSAAPVPAPSPAATARTTAELDGIRRSPTASRPRSADKATNGEATPTPSAATPAR